MKSLSLTARAFLCAALPTGLVAIVLAVIFLVGRVNDLEQAHYQRVLSLGHQVAASAEFALFANNKASLLALARAAEREQDVKAASVLDGAGQALVVAGHPTQQLVGLPGTLDSGWTKLSSGDDIFILPVVATPVVVDPWYAPDGDSGAKQVLGYVSIEVSHATVDAQVKNLLLVGGAITLAGLLLGAVLAARLTRNLTAPIEHVSHVVKEIGGGNFLARVEPDTSGSTRTLGEGVNRMAEQIRLAHQDLERRIAAATEELREKKDEAELATQAKSRFLAAASHDLRQPMHALGMFVARLQQLPHERETEELIGHVEKSVEAMQGLLTALLDISRLDAGTLTPELSPFPIADLFRRLAADLAAVADERCLKIRLRNSPLWVLSDPELLYRILLNLTGNAIAYTPQGGVLVGARRRAGFVRIEVWDTGIGIPEESREEVFKEFVQLHNPARERSKGLGLGLAIVDRTARLLGHRLQLRSRPQQGTCFAIEVPEAAARSQPGRRQAGRLDVTDARLDGMVALVVEDDAPSREAMVNLLAAWGCVVHVVESMEDPSAMALSEAPDVIVCDFRLPGPFDGIAAIEQLRTRYGRSVPACLVSGDTDRALVNSAAAANLPLLHKPVRPARLQALIKRLIKMNTPAN